MERIIIRTRRTVGRVLYGVSKLFINFNKNIKGVRKSKNVYPIKGNRANNFQVCYPSKQYKTSSLPVIFYFHGGGWAEYDKCFYSTFCKRLAKMGFIVCNVNYVLAPKYNLQQIIGGCIDIIKSSKEYVEKHYNADFSRVILSGDSAGAHISSLIAGMQSAGEIEKLYPEQSNGMPVITDIMLFYGVYNLESVLNTNFPSIDLYLKACLGKDFGNSEVMKKLSPISYLTENFPRTFIASGEIDRLHETQSLDFNNRLKALNIDVEYLFFNKDMKTGMHGFIAFDDFKSNCRTREEIEKFLNKNSLEEQW